MGYELGSGKHGQPEIRGYSKEYLEASSPRPEQIKDHLREKGIDGAAAAQIAAHHTRDGKELLSREELLRRHRDLAAQYGHQSYRVDAQALSHGRYQAREQGMHAQQAVTWARDHVFERSAVHDRRSILEAALSRGMGETTLAGIQQELDRRVKSGEFREIARKGVDQQFTTAAMIRMEREIIARMQAGNRRGYGDPMLVSPQIRIRTEDRHRELSDSQRLAVDAILISREKIIGLDGVAGAGKTTTLAVIREGAESGGYRVGGLAPTPRAAQKLAEAGMETSTLQKHLARGEQHDAGEKRLYVLDESSLASTRQLHELIQLLHPSDRALMVGDRRQHEAIEAGRPFAQLQVAGMLTVRLTEIVRLRDPDLKQVVDQLARGEVRAAIDNLDRQGRVHQISARDERIMGILLSSRPTIAPAWRSTRASIPNCKAAELSVRMSTASELWCRARTSQERTAPAGRHGADLRPATAGGCFRIPRRVAQFFRSRPYPIHRSGKRAQSGELRTGHNREHRSQRTAESKDG